MDELNQIYRVKNTINSTINKINDSTAVNLSNSWYWASSEGYNGTAWLWNMGNGRQLNEYKFESFSVRAIRVF